MAYQLTSVTQYVIEVSRVGESEADAKAKQRAERSALRLEHQCSKLVHHSAIPAATYYSETLVAFFYCFYHLLTPSYPRLTYLLAWPVTRPIKRVLMHVFYISGKRIKYWMLLVNSLVQQVKNTTYSIIHSSTIKFSLLSDAPTRLYGRD